jgi:hypothetical protein
MRYLLLPFTPRYIVLTLVVTGLVLSVVFVWRNPEAALHFAPVIAGFGFLTGVGVHDLLQAKHAILRN